MNLLKHCCNLLVLERQQHGSGGARSGVLVLLPHWRALAARVAAAWPSVVDPLDELLLQRYVAGAPAGDAGQAQRTLRAYEADIVRAMLPRRRAMPAWEITALLPPPAELRLADPPRLLQGRNLPQGHVSLLLPHKAPKGQGMPMACLLADWRVWATRAAGRR